MSRANSTTCACQVEMGPLRITIYPFERQAFTILNTSFAFYTIKCYSSSDISSFSVVLTVDKSNNAQKKSDIGSCVELTVGLTQWDIDLQAFADQGVNLANVNTTALGLGNKKNPIAGGSGTMYFDDIRLYRPPPEPAP